jgi:carbamoyl-phosphate synthase small subunit
MSTDVSHHTPPSKPYTAALVLDDGTIFYGYGFGAVKENVGEICFNTSMTGYQEVMSDPSYAGQIITFTFPHIGNVGANDEDLESINPASLGMITRELPTAPSNWREKTTLSEWLANHDIPGISGIDTRALTRRIRDKGAPKGVLIHDPSGKFDTDSLIKKAQEWKGLEGADLAKIVSCTQSYTWDEGTWEWPNEHIRATKQNIHVVAVDYGAKKNILRCLAATGCHVTVLPATSTAEDVLSHKPDGVFLSNGPGDPAATGTYAIPMIQGIMKENIPIFGICLGHQLLALALGGKTSKMHLGHRGANHPVKDLKTGLVEITSQNHGFEVIADSLPANATASHVSLFDGSNEGLALRDYPAFSVQYHPEASPGPQDSHYLFERFIEMIKTKKAPLVA